MGRTTNGVRMKRTKSSATGEVLDNGKSLWSRSITAILPSKVVKMANIVQMRKTLSSATGAQSEVGKSSQHMKDDVNLAYFSTIPLIFRAWWVLFVFYHLVLVVDEMFPSCACSKSF